MIVDWAGAIKNDDLAKVYIAGEEFSGIGYQGLLTVNTKTYVEEPKRTNDGSMPNIDDHETFIVPRCTINFKFFNIRDYQRLCRVVNSANQFPVSYFDKQFGEFRTYMMYAEPEEMSKIYNIGTALIGVIDYEISFVGTRNNLEKFEIKYITTGLTPRTIAEYSESIVYTLDEVVKVTSDGDVKYYKYKGSESASGKPVTDTKNWVQIYNYIDEVQSISWGNSTKILKASDLTEFYIIPLSQSFRGWNTRADGTGLNILPNSSWSVFENTNIYPIIS